MAADVWDLTKPEQGDHVLIALTPYECEAVLAHLDYCPSEAAQRAREEIRRCLRDQKEISS